MITDPQTLWSNGIQLCYQAFGDLDDPPMILVMGLGAQMIQWDDEFCAQLAARGFWVVRFDNRDVGKSTHMTGGSRLRLTEYLAHRFFHRPVAAPYTLRDMADDLVGLITGLGLESAHVVGVSMGGMIAQEAAMAYPARIRTLTTMMSTTGNPRLPGPTRAAQALLFAAPPKTKGEFIRHFVRNWKVMRVGGFPQDDARDLALAARTFDRGLNPAGVGRQFRAILAGGSRKERLGALRVPTLVLHGTVDPLIRPEAGKDTAAAIPGAKLVMIEGMGHAIPISMWNQVLGAIAEHAYSSP
jgi:pimeloyl-ACP methyl ester carboxylesterase